MRTLNKGMLTSAIAAVFSMAIYTPTALANPELAAGDLTPGWDWTRFRTIEVENDKLQFKAANWGVPKRPLNFSINRAGDLEELPYTVDDFEFSAHFESDQYFGNSGAIWRLEANGDLTEIFRVFETYYDVDGAIYYWIQDFFFHEGKLIVDILSNYYGDWGDEFSGRYRQIDLVTGEDTFVGFSSAPRYPFYYTHLETYPFNGRTLAIEETSLGFEPRVFGTGFDKRDVELLTDINPGVASSYAEDFTELNGEVYFVATGENGREIYKFDPDFNVSQFTDINPNGDSFVGYDYDDEQFVGSANNLLILLNNKIYFFAFQEDTGYELWETDGSAAGTNMVIDAVPGADGLSAYHQIEVVAQDDNGFYFQAAPRGPKFSSLWYTDGTADNTVELINLGDRYVSKFEIFELAGKQYIRVDSSGNRVEHLWSLSNTPFPTVENLFYDYVYVQPFGDAIIDGHYFLKAKKEWADDYALWITDGTAAGTKTFKGILADNYIAEYNGKAYFSGSDGVSGDGLWVADGTEQGTHLIKTVGAYKSIGVLDSGLVFWGDDGVTGWEPWITNGTEAGTRLIKEINVGDDFSYVGWSDGKTIGDKLYFKAEDSVNDEQLWVTDGTDPGTSMIGPLHPGGRWIQTLNPADIVEYNGSLYFQQVSSDYGNELWKYTPEITTSTGTGTLGDFVWQDTNGDGIQSSGEPGLEGVSVELQTCTGGFVESTTTDSMGFFQFNNVAEDYFQMQYFLPSGYEFSPVKAGNDIYLDSNANVNTGLTPCFDMTQGNQRLAADAGMVPNTLPSGDGLLGDYVWQDTDGDGYQDATEPGLANVTVNLQSCDGTAVSSTTTDSDGIFLFKNVGLGDYRLEFELANGHSYSPEKSAGAYQQDSNANINTGLTGCYDMNAGQQRRGVDAGMVPDAVPTETLKVVSAIYFAATNKLWVRAESSASPQGSANITASINTNGTTTELGQVAWKANKSFYQTNFRNLSNAPSTITLVSDSGAEVTANVEVQ